jgi:hypothetical protein
MVETCPHHDDIVRTAASNAAKLDLLLKGQEDFKESIEEIKKQLNSQDKESTIDRLKIKPFFVGIGIIMVLIITKLGESIIEAFIKAIK